MEWAFRLERQHLYRVGDLRTAEFLAAVDGEIVWLRGDGLDAALHRMLSTLADGTVFVVGSDGLLTAYGHSVPTDRLPQLEWHSLSQLIQPVLPIAGMVSLRIPRLPMSLIRSAEQQAAVMLQTDAQSFCQWALQAPEVRLSVCRFAFDGGQGVIVSGEPLPPLVGDRFWMAGNVGIPLGYCWSPAVDLKTLEQTFVASFESPPKEPALFVWKQDGTTEMIPAACFLPVTRSNVRATFWPVTSIDPI